MTVKVVDGRPIIELNLSSFYVQDHGQLSVKRADWDRVRANVGGLRVVRHVEVDKFTGIMTVEVDLGNKQGDQFKMAHHELETRIIRLAHHRAQRPIISRHEKPQHYTNSGPLTLVR